VLAVGAIFAAVNGWFDFQKNIKDLGVAAQTSQFPTENAQTIKSDFDRPIISISAASQSRVYKGGTVTFTVAATDAEIQSFTINESNITLSGFSAIVTVIDETLEMKTIVFSNIQDIYTPEGNKRFTIAPGVAVDITGNLSRQIISPSFQIIPLPGPALTIKRETPVMIADGGEVTYRVTSNATPSLGSFKIKESDITLNGFEATISVTSAGAHVQIITLSNMRSINSKSNYITIAEGVALDEFGNESGELSSTSFDIE